MTQARAELGKPVGGPVNVQLNGELHELPAQTSVGALVEQMGLADRRVAVELNREVLERAQWSQHVISEGDSIEVVQFVGGG